MAASETPINHQIILKQRPVGLIGDECFERAEAPIPEIEDGQALVRVIYLSVDPTQRGWMSHDTYLPAIALGEVIRAGGVGEVMASKDPQLPTGALVTGLTGWQQYAVAGPGGTAAVSVLPTGVDLRAAMSVLGATGITAYFGVTEIARPKAGETALVSGAAGATGSVAGQVARILGARVIGLAGTAEKCDWLTGELGFTAAINYRTDDVASRLDELCPGGIDVYFDNVGGDLLQIVLDRIALHARIVLCGAISEYNEREPSPGPSNLAQLVIRRSRMEGFLVLDYLPRASEAIRALDQWTADGKLHYRVEVADGLDAAPAALQSLFTGANTGKLIVQVGPEP